MPEIVQLRNSEHYKGVIRCIHVLCEFDCLQVAQILRAPYGTVTSVVATLNNEGYIEPVLSHSWGTGRNRRLVYKHAKYIKPQVAANTDIRDSSGRVIWMYTDKNETGAQRYRITPRWSEFLARWNSFLNRKAGDDLKPRN